MYRTGLQCTVQDCSRARRVVRRLLDRIHSLSIVYMVWATKQYMRAMKGRGVVSSVQSKSRSRSRSIGDNCQRVRVGVWYDVHADWIGSLMLIPTHTGSCVVVGGGWCRGRGCTLSTALQLRVANYRIVTSRATVPCPQHDRTQWLSFSAPYDETYPVPPGIWGGDVRLMQPD
jgi:hypothetical protein